jgi:ADP-ribose pyrophosphatase
MNTTRERRVLSEGKFVRLVAADGWEWAERVHASGAAVIAAVTDDRRLIMVEQFRIPMQARVCDLPAGLVGDDPGTENEAIIDAARRELFEETGYQADRWECAVSGPASPGLATEVYTLFIARGARRTGQGGGIVGENIQVHLAPLDGIEAWLEAKRRSGVLVDPKVYVGLWFLGERRT